MKTGKFVTEWKRNAHTHAYISHTRVHTHAHTRKPHTSHTHTLIHINTVSVFSQHLPLNRARG